MTQSSGFGFFGRTLCISLTCDVERRRHMENEFSKHGVRFSFIDAYGWDSTEVQDLMDSEFVFRFPPCFRCGETECLCENKSLIPPQIGNWLSHMKAWKIIADSGEQLVLVCEDDIVFVNSCHKTLDMLQTDPELEKAISTQEPLLLRLGWALNQDHQYVGRPYLNSKVKMSNPCYAISPAMARLLLSSLKQINTTSDVFLHSIIGSKVRSFTAIPPLAHDLSWSTGEFSSQIRPKQNHVATLVKKLDQTNPNDIGYADLLDKIKHEEERIRSYKEFNKSPVLERWRPS